MLEDEKSDNRSTFKIIMHGKITKCCFVALFAALLFPLFIHIAAMKMFCKNNKSKKKLEILSSKNIEFADKF